MLRSLFVQLCVNSLPNSLVWFQVEERLRVIYDKEWKKLKELDDRGAESSKIDATHDSIKKLLPKIKVSVSTVDAISRRIHKLRDEELQSQLNALIHRCVKCDFFVVLFAFALCSVH